MNNASVFEIPKRFFFVLVYFGFTETGSHYVYQAGLD